MAGDDDAGRAFSAVYKSAAEATLDQIGFGSYIMGATGSGIMQSAREYMATESQVSADLLGKQDDLSPHWRSRSRLLIPFHRTGQSS